MSALIPKQVSGRGSAQSLRFARSETTASATETVEEATLA